MMVQMVMIFHNGIQGQSKYPNLKITTLHWRRYTMVAQHIHRFVASVDSLWAVYLDIMNHCNQPFPVSFTIYWMNTTPYMVVVLSLKSYFGMTTPDLLAHVCSMRSGSIQLPDEIHTIMLLSHKYFCGFSWLVSLSFN